MLIVQGKNYETVPEGIFDEYGGFPARIVVGANTQSGEAVVILVADKWLFVNQTAK